MGLRINHNSAAINGQRNLTKNDSYLSKTLERLSSGMKINRAADGAAGLVISEQMRAQITGLSQAIDNSSTAVSMVQTAEGALDEINTLLNKARQLVLHASNEGANDNNQLAADQNELDNVISSVTRISQFTQFGTKKLLDGAMSGAGELSTGLTRVRVGNLANNPALSTGTASMVVSGGARESNTMRGGIIDDGYIFTPANVTGMNIGTGTVNSGVTISLKVDSDTFTLTTTEPQTTSQVATALNAIMTGFAVAYSTGSAGFVVTRDAVGEKDFTSSLAFTKGSVTTVAGVGETVTATLSLNGSSVQAAAIIFTGAATLSGISTATTVATGTVFTVNVSAADGSTGWTPLTYTSVNGDTLNSVLTNLSAQISGVSSPTMGFSGGAALSLVGGAQSGFQIALTRSNSAITADFNFSMEVDWTNAVTNTYEVHRATLSGVDFPVSGGGNPASTTTFFTAAAVNSGNVAMSGGNTTMSAGVSMAMTINGVTRIVTGAGQTLDTIAASFNALFSNEGYRVTWLDTNDVASGTYFEGAATGLATTPAFYVSNINGADFTMSLSVDNILGVDSNIAGVESQQGSATNATVNIDTIAQDRTDNTLAISGHAASTVANVSGLTQNTAGVDTSAILTTSNGVSIGLTQVAVTVSGALTLGLDDNAKAVGYERFFAELATGLGTAGGVVTFDLSEGAVFQVGPNDSQRVGVTIDSVAADELGRNVVGAGKLLSLDDLVSTKRGAIINGNYEEALRIIDSAIDEVTNMRGRMGAIQSNTLETGLNSLRATQENLINAESTIRDTDFAKESAEFTRYNILVQSSTAMLAQANQLPQNVLKLLG